MPWLLVYYHHPVQRSRLPPKKTDRPFLSLEDHYCPGESSLTFWIMGCLCICTSKGFFTAGKELSISVLSYLNIKTSVYNREKRANFKSTGPVIMHITKPTSYSITIYICYNRKWAEQGESKSLLLITKLKHLVQQTHVQNPKHQGWCIVCFGTYSFSFSVGNFPFW